MRAIVNINYRDMKGSEYKVHEVSGSRVTLEYKIKHQTILVDFTINELQIILQDEHVHVFRNQGYRDGYFIKYSSVHGYVIQYSMPNGKEFRNVVKNPFNPDDYKSIPNKEYTDKFINH